MSLIDTDLFGNTHDKVAIAIERIKAFCPPEGYYVAFSGGKDSVVILDLVKRAEVPFDAHYNLTTVDPPELVKFIKTFSEVQIDYPEISMWKLIIKKRMPPTRIVRYCCEYFKESGGGDDRTVLTGIRWAESSKRSRRRMTEACYRNSRKHYLHPIIDWSESEVWEYIKSNNIDYCSLYDKGFKRIGCIGCPMGGNKHMAREFERWPTYKRAYIKAFDRCVKKRIEDGLKTEWTTGQEMFNWWMEDKHHKGDPDQTVMFE